MGKLKSFVQPLFLLAIIVVAIPLRIAYSVLKALRLIKSQVDTTFNSYRNFLSAEVGCESCTNAHYERFDSEQEFERFENSLRTEFIPYAKVPFERTKPDWEVLSLWQFGEHSYRGGTLYKCKRCSHLWELSVPDTYWRGYFKPIGFLGEEPSEKLQYVQV